MAGTRKALPGTTTEAVAELGRIVLAENSLPDVLGRVATSARRAIPGAHDVSVTLVVGDRGKTVAHTGELALRLDEAQYEHGYGPCLDASSNADHQVISDMRTETRWPGYAPRAVKIGALSSLSIPIPVQENVTACLNVYATKPHAFDESAVETAQAFASYAAVAIANAHEYSNAAQLAAQMQEAMASRAVIEQAKGVLIARHGCSADAAFALLTRMSQNANRKLRDVAASIVAEVQRSA
jgi:GAF domain-containing protein